MDIKWQMGNTTLDLNLHSFLNGLFVVNGCLALLACTALFLTLVTMALRDGRRWGYRKAFTLCRDTYKEKGSNNAN